MQQLAFAGAEILSKLDRLPADNRARVLGILDSLLEIAAGEMAAVFPGDGNDLVRCQCGYTMARREIPALDGEKWTCYSWHHRSTGEVLHHCPDCGVATSALSTRQDGLQTLDKG